MSGDAALLPLLDVLRERAGLVFSDARRGGALASVRRAMETAGEDDAAAYLALVRRDDAALDALLAEATVGETYFFRDPAQWEVVRGRALADARARRAPGRPLRAWSAACSTGEEPYTLAIVCHQAGMAAREREILGTDLSRPRLEAARAARYGKWALRDVPEAIVRRYFTPRGRRWELDPAVREGVEFRSLNLVEDAWPSPAAGVWEMDVVLCRNMLIYLDEPSIRRVAERLVETLAPGGWLFCGPSDPSIADYAPCEVIVTPAGLAYRRRRLGVRSITPRIPSSSSPSTPSSPVSTSILTTGRAPAVADPPPSTPTDRREQDFGAARGGSRVDIPPVSADDPTSRRMETAAEGEAERRYAARDYDGAAEAAEAVIAAGDAAEATWIVRVRALANRGRLGEAEAACAAALERHRASAELHDLHALLLMEAGRPRDAVPALRQALYLDPGFVVAHVRVADAQARLGNREAARRSLRNAEGLLAAMGGDAVVPASDGTPAAHLLRTVRARLAMLAEGAA